MAKISVVVNTLNEEGNLPRALGSVKSLADEIVVVDMHSVDKTREIAKRAGAKVYLHRRTGYVEPARNYAISKAKGDWIFILDADEEVSSGLSRKIKEVVGDEDSADFYRIPRLNVIFGKSMRYSRWWPDYNIRLFRRGAVRWNEIIHSVPETYGKGLDFPEAEKFAIIHHNYSSVSQYLERMGRYTDIQAKGLVREGYKFSWRDVLKRPASEFVSRYFAALGYKDGVHGLVLSLLQSFSELLVYVKVWEMEKFREVSLKEGELGREFVNAGSEVEYWLVQTGVKGCGLTKRLWRKVFS